MIIKTTNRKRMYTYKELVNHIAHGGNCEKALYANYRNLYPRREDTDSIVTEMEACGNRNKNAQKKVYHAVLCWREEEVPTQEQADEAVSIYLAELGMEECQCYYGMHRIENRIHVHVCINKIDPDTYKSVKPAQGWYKKANERTARRIELAQGWEVLERGKLYEVIDGKVCEKRDRRRGQADDSQDSGKS